MNVLIFVMTMIMLLSLMTYARLETYRSSQVFQIIFKHYMQEDERAYINSKADDIYNDKFKYTEKDEKGNEVKKKPRRIDASPRIGISLLFDSQRDAKKKEWDQTTILLKNLLRTLYEKQPFYEKIENERPAFIDDLLRAMTQAIDELPKDKKPKTAEDLANLKLSDKQLDDVLYKMLHGAYYLNVLTDEQKAAAEGQRGQKNNKTQPETNVEASEDDEDAGIEVDEYKSPKGYFSLLDFITSKSKPKVRVFLASRDVLLAIFKDPETVESIIRERERLHQQAVSGSPVEQLDETFKNQFLRMKDPAIDEESLNFQVNKTNPKYYK